MRRLFIISDLHLGGRPDGIDEAGEVKTGFQICHAYAELVAFIDWVSKSGKRATTEELELVINGDIVDFLAEDDFGGSLRGAQIWTTSDADAITKLNHISERTRGSDGRGVFDALRDFLAAGHRLTLLLGNHDVELSLPSVRRHLSEMLESESKSLQFIFDGEAYTIGRVLVEHGNRYDRWNMIGYSGLRQERSVRSRRLPIEEAEREERYFVPPAGTYVVIHFMNRIKGMYRFIDLLKPEDSTVIPLLLALEPDRRKHLKEILNASPVLRNYIRHGLRTPVIPKKSGDLKSLEETEITLTEVLRKTLGADARHFADADDTSRGNLSAVQDADLSEIIVGDKSTPLAGNLSAKGLTQLGESLGSLKKTAFGVVDWFRARRVQFDARARSAFHYYDLLSDAQEPQEQPQQLYAALKHLNYNDKSFDTGTERAEYLDAALETARQGDFDVVIYGHTHLPKKIALNVAGALTGDTAAGAGRWYLNTGTWCDVMQLPATLTGTYAEAEPALKSFVRDLRENNLSGYIRRYLSFAEVLVDPSGKQLVDEAHLFSYGGPGHERSAPLTDILTRKEQPQDDEQPQR